MAGGSERSPAVKVGLVGGGRGGAALLELLLEWPDAELTVVVDRPFSTSISWRPRTLKASKRSVKIHDISTSRDIIIAVDRFNELSFKHKLSASVVDVLILSTAKYLIDFFHIPAKQLYIVTLDNALWRGSKKAADVPSAFNPNAASELAAKVFA